MISLQLRSVSQSLRRGVVATENLRFGCQAVGRHELIRMPFGPSRFSTSVLRGEDETSKPVPVPNTNDSPDTIPQEFLVEHIPEDGEWAGCSRKFMAPLQISVRGAGTTTPVLSCCDYYCYYLKTHSVYDNPNFCTYLLRCSYQPIIQQGNGL